ncbi:hypothetical protein SDC9_74222 [bioreactor metagenome]|uniref:ribonucleoside-diphosphate reductase n=1 Tax=bioreactor metagenome TaxID=1076179 RepID=A0A644YHB5_9ZZZZ|nr:TIGR03905 family TSCPD domain-containing protein [Oscillospiraceae bacterium]
MRYEYKTNGTCSRLISFNADEDGKITDIKFTGGCDGNLKAISRAMEGKNASEIKNLFKGITCGSKPTSCSDQLSRALDKYMRENAIKCDNGVFFPAEVMLPENADMTKWSVVACDQFTSEPEYWENADRIVGSAPSTLRITLPEIYLDKPGVDEKIASINKSMREYMRQGILKQREPQFILTERTLSNGAVRRGLVGMIDLEKYDYSKGSASAVRATEGTVTERIPPRLRVRKSAILELPHVMLLIDDREKTVIEPLSFPEVKNTFEKLYDFKLMLSGGSVCGYAVSPEYTKKIDSALSALADREAFDEKYNLSGDDNGVLLFAVGDGNHSLATAKAFYERIKSTLSPADAAEHPARYALCEVVNLHDPALEFEPIHRVLFGASPEAVEKALRGYFELSETQSEEQSFAFRADGRETRYFIKNPPSAIAVGSVQSFIDDFIKTSGRRVDYIHGADVARRLADEGGAAAFLLPDTDKNMLFKTVISDGALPRKTFSMGHACDKRYYLEARRIQR